MQARPPLSAVLEHVAAPDDDAPVTTLVALLARAFGVPALLIERRCGRREWAVTASSGAAAIDTDVDVARDPWRRCATASQGVDVVEIVDGDAISATLGTRHVVIAPLARGFDPGVLVVGAPRGELDEQERAAVLLVAARVAVALGQRDARGRGARTRARLRAAIRIGEQLDIRCQDMRPGFDAVCREVATVLGVQGCAITLLDPERGVFVREAQVGLPQRWMDAHAPFDPMMIEKQPHLWKPIGVFPPEVLPHLPEAALYAELGVRMIAMAILRDEGRVVGALSTVALGEDRLHDDDERLWLESIGMRVAGAVRVARLTSAARASEARFRKIVESCLEGVWVIGADRRISFVNAQLAELVGYRPEEMIGRSPLDFMSPAAHGDVLRRFELRRQGISERWQVPLRHRDGRDVHTIVASSPMLDDRGAFAGVVSFMTDVSERRALEQKVQQAQKLESLGLLAGGLAHDFNNLLVGVIGNATLAREELPPASSLVPLLDDIERAGLRAAELTRQMLAYAGKAERRVEAIDIGPLIRDTLPLVSGVMSRKADLRLELDDGPLFVAGDAIQLRQIVMNLLTNASDALGDAAGSIVVRTGRVRLTPAEREAVSLDRMLEGDDYGVIDVIDDGCGMDAATQARIFDPFFTTKFTGRGLGLAAVLGILRAHRGTITVDSQAGAGSRFRVFVPLAGAAEVRVAEAVPPTPVTQVSAVRGRRVLVVDDEPDVRQLAVRSLERAGFVVESASGGAEALARFESVDPAIDVVVLDLMMPGLAGNDVLALLRARRPGVPVVVTSGFDEFDVRHRLGDDTASSFLAKPWTVNGLVGAVAGAVGRGPR